MTIEEVTTFQIDILDFITKLYPELPIKMREKRDLDDEMKKSLDEGLTKYFEMIVANRPLEDDDDDDDDSNVGVDTLDKATSKK